MRVLFGVILLLMAILLAVVFSDSECIPELLGISEQSQSLTFNRCIGELLGLEGKRSKSEVLKFLGISVAGLLLMLQAVIGDRRVKAMQKTAEAQANAAEQQAVANTHTEGGQRQERLKIAIEHLGNEFDSVRMGATYELFHLAQDTPSLGQTVLDILCAHIRTQTSECRCRDGNNSKLSIEIESLLNLIFLNNHEVFEGRVIDLKDSCLRMAELSEARLSKAIMTGVHLQGAVLWGAQLQGANLEKARLEGANLESALLHGADLSEAHLQDACLGEARLHGANLQEAQLQGADLQEAQLQGADLHGAQLQEADLRQARLHGVRPSLRWTAAETTTSRKEHFKTRMYSGVNVQTDLNGVIFEGGLTQEILEDLVRGLPTERKEQLERRLQHHVGRPASEQLSAERGAKKGAYTPTEAGHWVTEYEGEAGSSPDSE